MQADFLIALQKIVDGLDAQPNGMGRTVLVHVFERKEGRSGTLDDLLDSVIDGSVVAALETGKLDRHQVGMAGRELGGPELVV